MSKNSFYRAANVLRACKSENLQAAMLLQCKTRDPFFGLPRKFQRPATSSTHVGKKACERGGTFKHDR